MKKVNFNKEWSFSLNEGESYAVNLPYDFSIVQGRDANAPCAAHGGYFKGGYGVYEKTFTPKRGKKHFLMLDGSFGITEVLINGNLVYINKYGYNSFYADLSDYLICNKENKITVRVNNKWQPNARWYTGSGIYRDVFLCTCDRTYIDPFGVFAYAKSVNEETAYMALDFELFADQKGEAVAEFEVYEAGRAKPVLTFNKHFYAELGKNTVSTAFQIENPKNWAPASPNMYKIKTTVKLGKCIDTDESVFGVRTVVADAQRGLLINGKEVKLKGGCIHHDHGPIGACSYKEAEYRRVSKLKEAGFNAIRLSHNPQSPYLYEACDNLGLLVIDELFDYWTDGKQKDDMHAFFDDNYQKWTNEIVRKNRVHPSIIMWSTGNEIPQKSGRGYGYVIAQNIAKGIRALDNTRPLTHGFCSLWDDKNQYEEELATNHLDGDQIDFFASKIAITADTVDVLGYNYLEYRAKRDLMRFPNKLIVFTETYAQSSNENEQMIKNDKRLIGDFVWTAWDYFGETGIGKVQYDKPVEGIVLLPHPYHISNCGDFNICGDRKPQSYYREISWGLRKDPYIITRHPKDSHLGHYLSVWGFYECESRWCYRGYEGKPLEVYVFADCDELVLEINGKEVARKTRKANAIYDFITEYKEGSISAKAITNGKITGVSVVKTEGVPSKLVLETEKSSKKAEIIYAWARVIDENGNTCAECSDELEITVSNGQILGMANSDISSSEPYVPKEAKTQKRKLHNGKCLVVIKKPSHVTEITVEGKASAFPKAKLTV